MFSLVSELEVGAVAEVEGTTVRVDLSGEVSELTRTYGGHVYGVGQIGSLIKIHYGRRILLAYVRMLRMRSDYDDADEIVRETIIGDARLLVADLFGEGTWNQSQNRFQFHRGVKTYPLPGQKAYLTTRDELLEIYRGAQRAHESEFDVVHDPLTIGTYFGADVAPCSIDVDRLFGHHCAVLGTTGSGKSAAVAAIFHGLCEYETDEGNLRPRVVIVDPHREYARAFGGRAISYQAYDTLPGTAEASTTPLRLPYWLMSSEEFRDLVIGKTEFEATRENNIVRKALKHSRLVSRGWIEPARSWIGQDADVTSHPDAPRPIESQHRGLVDTYNIDTPDPFSLDEFERHIREEQGIKVTHGKWQQMPYGDFESHRKIIDKLRVLRSDRRLQFMMKEHDDHAPELAEVVAQFIGEIEGENGTPVDLRIIDISGLPNEVAGPLTAAIARLLFEYKTWQTREERQRDPVVFVCEEAHRYVPDKGEAEYRAAQTAIRRLAREGRKYGIGLMAVSQRPADVEGTVLSQCNTWIVLRLANPTDQRFIRRFLPDNFVGLSTLLPALARREALVLGAAAALPARIMIRELKEDQLPDSGDMSFVSGWNHDPASDSTIKRITDRWQAGATENE